MAAAPKPNQPSEPAQSIATPAQAVSVSSEQSPIVDFWDEQSQEATADLHPPLFEACADAAAQPQPNPVPPCPECQAVCVVRLPRTWRECDEFHCNKCANQWQVWDSEKAKAIEPHTVAIIKARNAYSQKEAEARDEKGRRLDAEAQLRALEARNLEPIVRLTSTLDTFIAQMKQPALAESEALPRSISKRSERPTEKKQDLSHYFADAKLTPKQLQAASGVWEFEKSKIQIAKDMGVTRRAVYNLLKRADAKIKRSQEYKHDQYGKLKAKSPSE